MLVALVTGGTSGIGLAIAARLAEEGYRTYITSAHSPIIGERLERERKNFIYRRADVTEEQEMRQVLAEIESVEGGLDVLVNNAGYTEVIAHRDLEAATDEVWDRVMSTNLMGTWWTSRAARSALAKREGVIINISSIAGLRATGSSLPYAVSKAAVNHLTVLLAASIGDKIRVNAIAPGLVDTPWTKDWEEIRANVSAKAPLKRSAKPEDIAEVAWGIINAKYMTGQVVVVDGGLTLKHR